MEAVDKRGTAAWARFVADDCLFVLDDGSLFSKDGMLAYYKKVSTAYDRNESPRDYVVRVHGNTAVLAYRLTGHEQLGSTDLITDVRRSETLIKQNGAWLLIVM